MWLCAREREIVRGELIRVELEITLIPGKPAPGKN